MSESFLTQHRKALAISSMATFAISLSLYWITCDPGVSYWDCPEYVIGASKLEIGHPPGNPVWILAMRVATIPFAPEFHAYVINLWSGIFMALAAMLLCLTIFVPLRNSISNKRLEKQGKIHLSQESKIGVWYDFIAGTISAGAALCFALCDSAWFSAVEAEVYAMSTFLAALALWVITLWWLERDGGKRKRLLVLLAYVIGLSMGVHQLNLLLIPVFVVTIYYRYHRRLVNPARLIICLLFSFALICIILMGLMPGTLEWAKVFEIFFVNTLGWPYDSGVIIYCVVLLALAILSLLVTTRFGKQYASPFIFLFIGVSGIFLFGGNFIVAAVLSLIATFQLCHTRLIKKDKVSLSLWMLLFVLVGYSSFGLIMIRGKAAPPMNQGAPDNIFALASYINREQYGATPLIYGPTPYSRPVLEETFEGDQPRYDRYVLKKGRKVYKPLLEAPGLNYRSRMMTREDSMANLRILERGHGYILSDYSFTLVTTPELEMWLPRITSQDPADLTSYEGWAGMNEETMERVEISEVMDTAGIFRPRLDLYGNRPPAFSYRPGYMQHLRYFMAYQAYYMYFRYLFWNFIGRQNDFHSRGEIDHGNFVTGIPVIDISLIGDSDKQPDEIGKGNRGYNRYFGIPFIFGILGIIYLCGSGRRSRRIMFCVTLLFLMTGLAIVVYLNQNPGEPRERDYAFLGSYMAFAMWIGAGFLALFKFMAGKLPLKIVAVVTTVVCVGVPTLMALENFDDHDRRGRYETTFYAGTLSDIEYPAIIFTQGDNSSFPLWYVMEVLGKGERHTPVDVTLLAAPSYVANLKENASGKLNIMASAGDILYNKYLQVQLPPAAISDTMALGEALRALYVDPTSKPMLAASVVTLPRAPGDTVAINLHEFTGGKKFLSFRQLMLLDIIASQAEENADNKIVFFPSSLGRSFYKPLLPALRPTFFGQVYAPSLSDGELDTITRISIERELRKLESLDVKAHYADPVGDDIARRHRAEMIIAAKIILEEGDTLTPGRIVRAIERVYPLSLLLPGAVNMADTSFYEDKEYRSLLKEMHKATGSQIYQTKALEVDSLMENRHRVWMRYYNSLTPEERNTLSNRSRHLLVK